MLAMVMVLGLLLGLGLAAIRLIRMQAASSGYVKNSRSAFHIAASGLRRAGALVTEQPEYFHREAVLANPVSPTYAFPKAQLAAADRARMGRLDYAVVMSRPRLSGTPPMYQAGGSAANRFAFYVYQFDVVGTVNGDPVTGAVESGGGAAMKQLRGDVRVGPIPVNE